MTGTATIVPVLPVSPGQGLSIVRIAAMFVSAGVLHVVRPRLFLAIVPPWLPAPRALVFLSGAAEVVGGLGMLLPEVRSWAAWGLAALLVAVFPANLYMWLAADRFRAVPRWALAARLPLQAVWIAWVLWAGLS